MRQLNILSIQRTTAGERAQIEGVDPGIRLLDAGGWFDGEIRMTWDDYAAARYLAANSIGSGTREERDGLLAAAEVIVGGWPFPRDLRPGAAAQMVFTSDKPAPATFSTPTYGAAMSL